MDRSVRELIENAQKARIDILSSDLRNRGFEAAVEFAKNCVFEADEAFTVMRLNMALAVVELSSDDKIVYQNHDMNLILRQHCAGKISIGEQLSHKLRVFAARSLIESPPSQKRGRPTSRWTKILALGILRDLRTAKIPVYHGDQTSADAQFYGVDAVAAAIGTDERTLRGWWQKRAELLGDI